MFLFGRQYWRRTALALAMAFLASAFWAGAALAKEVTVTGVGDTRDAALKDALRLAVEQAVGTLVESETLVRNMEVVKDEIYAKSRGFVQDWDVLEEGRSGGQFTVTARVRVDTSPNSALMTKLQRLKLIEVGLRDPRIAVIIPEFYLSAPSPAPAGETEVIRKLIEAGFNRVVDAKQVAYLRYSDALRRASQGNREDIKEIALNLGVDYLIVGEASSQYVGNLQDSGIHSSRAQIEARLIKADNAEIIAARSFQAGGVDVAEAASAKVALRNAGAMMGDYMVRQLMTFASNPEKGLSLIIRRVTSVGKVNMLVAELREISGVKNVFFRTYTGGVATLDLNYTGTPQTLATALGKLSSATLDVTQVTDSAIEAIMLR